MVAENPMETIHAAMTRADKPPMSGKSNEADPEGRGVSGQTIGVVNLIVVGVPSPKGLFGMTVTVYSSSNETLSI